MRLPARGDRVGGPVRPDQQVGLGLATPGMHHAVAFGVPLGFAGRAGQHAVAGQQVVDLAGHLDAAIGQHNEVVRHPLQLGQDVRGQHHRHAVIGDGRHDRGHEVVPGQRVERRHRLVQHEKARPPAQRQGQRQLGLLTPGQLAGLAIQGYVQLSQPGFGVGLVEVTVQVPGQVQRVGDREPRVQRRVLGDEGDPVERGRRPRRHGAENGDAADGRCRQAHRQVQQGGLAGAIRSDQGHHVPLGNGHRALAQGPGLVVALAQTAGFYDVHATPSVSPPAAPRRSPEVPRRSRKSRSTLVNSATIPSSSSPAVSAVANQPCSERRRLASSGSATGLRVVWMKVPWPGRPTVRPLFSNSR